MARRTGATLALSLGGTAVPAMRTVGFDQTDEEVDGTAAGDTAPAMHSLGRTRTSLEWTALLNVEATYVIPGRVVGTEVTYAFKTYAGETSGITSGTLKVNRFHIDAAYNDIVALSGTLGDGSSGVAATSAAYDLVHAS
jgi:hypothetical protein